MNGDQCFGICAGAAYKSYTGYESWLPWSDASRRIKEALPEQAKSECEAQSRITTEGEQIKSQLFVKVNPVPENHNYSIEILVNFLRALFICLKIAKGEACTSVAVHPALTLHWKSSAPILCCTDTALKVQCSDLCCTDTALKVQCSDLLLHWSVSVRTGAASAWNRLIYIYSTMAVIQPKFWYLKCTDTLGIYSVSNSSILRG